MSTPNLYALAQAGYTAKGDLHKITLQSLRRRARKNDIGARWTPSGLNRNGVGEYVISDLSSNALIGTALNDDELTAWLTDLLKEAEGGTDA